MHSTSSSVSSASVSKSKMGRNIASTADEMLRASLLNRTGAPSSSSASTSRTLAGSGESLADEMLRTSLSGRNPAPVSSSASVSRSRLRTPGGTSTDDMLRRSLASSRGIPSTVSSSECIAPPPYQTKLSEPGARAPVHDSIKLRKQQLKAEIDAANAAAIRRNTSGLFQAACSTDLLFLIDTTYSMAPYIDAAKEQVKSIVADIKEAFLNESEVRIGIVSYKDHGDTPNIEFLDFTSSTTAVYSFLGTLSARGGADAPEDVLGGIHQALSASWTQQTRCLIHIADAPAHGSTLHDLTEGHDSYYTPGSEPHGLKYEPLLMQLRQLKVNYVMLRITNHTDRMALTFSAVYGHENTKLFSGNTYFGEVNKYKASKGGWSSGPSSLAAKPQFEELQLGTTYSELRHLVVKSVTTSVSRTAGRLSVALSRERAAAKGTKTTTLSIIGEDDDTEAIGRVDDVPLETMPPQWRTPGWLDERLEVDGFCPAVDIHHADTLRDMMSADENIKLSTAELTIHARSRPFAQGALRTAAYAHTSASTTHYVIKSFKKAGYGRAEVVEDMLMQALCKAFALEFNGLLNIEPPLDFLVTSCLQKKKSSAGGGENLSLEPFIEGDYVKYNNNAGWVNEDLSGDHFNQMAQAFSHFTFERSWGHLLVDDLQGVGHMLTDPSIQTLDTNRFKLNDTNLHEEGFKFFFATHVCNTYCTTLGLKSSGSMFISKEWMFRETWPKMEPTVCCSNKLCRSIIRLASAHKSPRYPECHWCDVCWPQLESSTVEWLCTESGDSHEFTVSRFYYESQGQPVPRKCQKHRGKDATETRAAKTGASIWSRMKSKDTKGSIVGRGW